MQHCFNPIVKARVTGLITLLKSFVPQRENHQHVCIITHLLYHLTFIYQYLALKCNWSNFITYSDMVIPEGLNKFFKFHWSHIPENFINTMSLYQAPLFTPIFSVNLPVTMFDIASLASPVNVMKIAWARFSSQTKVNASQILISVFQFAYKGFFLRVCRALKSFISFASTILLPIVIGKCHTFYYE